MTPPLPWHRLWFELSPVDLETELRQCRDEGRVLGEIESRLVELQSADLLDPVRQEEARRLLDRSIECPIAPDFPFHEPNDLESIRAARPESDRSDGVRAGREPTLTDERGDRILAAWTGRAAGCLLGKPVEGWRRPRLHGFLRDQTRWPLDRYLSLGDDPAVHERYEVDTRACFLENVTDGTPEDDDLNYTICALALLEKHGPSFTSQDVANFWMNHLPVLHTCTAERIAYRNFCLGLAPPHSATFRNPYREWIGAQIRGDLFGYVCAGDPERAAEFAHRDARISHVKNGIYGEMWIAAVIARAFLGGSPDRWIRAGLAQIPARCRLAKAVQHCLDQWRNGATYDDAVETLHQRFDERSAHDWCHAVSNAAVVAIALLHGERSFGSTICKAVQACFDTDCNGASSGSAVAAAQGSAAIDEAWRRPLAGMVHSGVAGFHRVSLGDLAGRTEALARRFAH